MKPEANATTFLLSKAIELNNDKLNLNQGEGSALQD
jgi:hypothetical protein